MFIKTADGPRINLDLVKYFDCDEPGSNELLSCRFEFNDGTGMTGSITAEQLARIDSAELSNN